MEKVYRNTALFIILIIIGVQWGFYRTYTSQFPNFRNATNIIHIHGALLMSWLVLLVVQPMLIHMGKASLHRTIGKVSWVLGPAIIVMLFLVGRGGYQRGIGNISDLESVAFMALDIRGFLSFALFWALAMINRKNSHAHMRYMIATGILAIGPGVGRGLISSFNMSIWDAITVTDAIDLAIVGVLLSIDIYRKKDYKPFLVVFGVLFLGGLLWQVRGSETWQQLANAYARLFY